MFVLRVEIPSLWCWISQPSTIWWTYCQPHVPCSSAMVYFPKGMGEFFLSIVRIPLKMLCRSKTPSSIMFWPWHIWRFCSNFTIFHNPKWRFKPHNGRFDHAQLDLIMKPLRNCFFHHDEIGIQRSTSKDGNLTIQINHGILGNWPTRPETHVSHVRTNFSGVLKNSIFFRSFGQRLKPFLHLILVWTYQLNFIEFCHILHVLLAAPVLW